MCSFVKAIIEASVAASSALFTKRISPKLTAVFVGL